MDYQNYYKILDIPESAGIEDLKKAYREKVKKYHPDVSVMPDAEERFVEITEAYELLLRKILYTKKKKETESETGDYIVWDDARKDWMREQLEKIRRMAYQQAKMKFEEFKKTPNYRTARAFSKGSDYVVFIFGFLIIVAAFWGIRDQYMRDVLSITSVFAGICVVAIGITISSYSYRQIRK